MPPDSRTPSDMTGTDQRTACPDPAICTNTDCRSSTQTQFWISSQAKPLLYIIFKIHEPLPFQIPPKPLRGKQILLEYFIMLCTRRALLKSLHYCAVLTNSLCDMHKEDQIFANLRIFFFALGQLVKPINMNCVWADEEKRKHWIQTFNILLVFLNFY